MITVDNPIARVFEYWSAAVEPIVGKGHYSMDASITRIDPPYARLLMLGMPLVDGDLEGNEAAVNISVQTDSFASGQKATSKAYEIDSASHQALVDMGFRRTYGPELMENAESSIKRTVSRYSRVYTDRLLNE